MRCPSTGACGLVGKANKLGGGFHRGFFSTRRRRFQTWCHQHLWPQGKSQSPPASLGDSPRSACAFLCPLPTPRGRERGAGAAGRGDWEETLALEPAVRVQCTQYEGRCLCKVRFSTSRETSVCINFAPWLYDNVEQNLWLKICHLLDLWKVPGHVGGAVAWLHTAPAAARLKSRSCYLRGDSQPQGHHRGRRASHDMCSPS